MTGTPNSLLPKKLKIYSDGSHKGRWGSWAYVIVQTDKIIHEASGRTAKTTSLRMEFQAALEALRFFAAGPAHHLHLYSDSQILVDCATGKKLIPKVVQDQMQELMALTNRHQISWFWVRGHAGNPFNERCDFLCLQTREGTLPSLDRSHNAL